MNKETTDCTDFEDDIDSQMSLRSGCLEQRERYSVKQSFGGINSAYTHR